MINKNYQIKRSWESYKDNKQTTLDKHNIHLVDDVNTLAKCKKGNKKMVNINEVAPVTPLFDGAEKIEKKDVLNKQIIVEAFAELEGDDGKFGVIKFTYDGKVYTTSINEMMLERVLEATQKVGLDVEKSTNKEKVLAQTIEVTIIEKVSTKNKNRTYFVFGTDEEVQEIKKAK